MKRLDEFGEKAGTVVRENIAHIILAAIILLMVLLSFVNITAGDGQLDWFNLAINITLQVAVFVPYRWRQKRISGQTDPYKENKRIYGERVASIHAGNRLSDFAKFCEVKTQELKRAKQLQIVHAAGIDTNVYDDGEYETLTEKQRKAIEKAKRVRVKPINPSCITSNSSKVRGYGIDFDETAEDAKGIAGKVLPMLVWAVILAYIALDGIGYGGIMAVVMIVFRIVMCLTAMFSGIMSGDGFVVKKDKVILRRIDFINLFYEWAQVPLLAGKNE